MMHILPSDIHQAGDGMMADYSKPLYQQIFDELTANIRNGVWKDGDRIPSEKELAEQFGVSRITSKKALEMLADAGCIRRMPGKGSYVKKVPGAAAASQAGTQAVMHAGSPGSGSPGDRAGTPGSDMSAALAGLPAAYGTSYAGVPIVSPAYSSLGTSESAMPYAEGQPTRRPLLIGLILPDFDSAYGIELLASVEQHAAENGIFMILRRSHGDQAIEEKSIDEVLLLGVDGIIIMPVHGEHYAPKILRLVLDGFPIVFVDRHLRGLNVPFVGSDNLAAAKKAADFVLDLGHRRISLLSPLSEYNTAVAARVEGFVKSHAEHGIAIEEGLWLTNLTATLPGLNTPDNIQKDIEAIQALLRRDRDITCLFSVEYNIALLADIAVKALGLRVPEDVSILCFDSPQNFMNASTLTHMRQREKDMGEIAIRMFLNLLRKESGAAENLYLEADLIEGASTARPKH